MQPQWKEETSFKSKFFLNLTNPKLLNRSTCSTSGTQSSSQTAFFWHYKTKPKYQWSSWTFHPIKCSLVSNENIYCHFAFRIPQNCKYSVLYVHMSSAQSLFLTSPIILDMHRLFLTATLDLASLEMEGKMKDRGKELLIKAQASLFLHIIPSLSLSVAGGFTIQR